MRTLALLLLTAFCVGAPLAAAFRGKRRYVTPERLAHIDARRDALRDPVGPLVPQQIHITYGQDVATSMNVAWTTRNQTTCNVAYAFVQGPTGGRMNFTGVITTWDTPSEFLYSVNMTGLAPRTTYSYQVGCPSAALSAPATFTTGTTDPSWVPTFAVFGDMGLVNEQSVNSLIADARSGAIDVNLFVGDMAYDLDSNGGETGDAFMNSIQNYSSIIPIQWTVGNHEADFLASFRGYRARIGQWIMGGQGNVSGNGLFHSFDLGLAHLVMISSEVYFWPSEWGLLMMPQQFAWLEADLAAAAANRAERPWIIVMTHRPFYCSPNDDDDECHVADNPVRVGILGDFAIEPLLFKYGVDLTITAHEHAYARYFPMYNYTYDVPEDLNHYVNPTKPVHIIAGAAGCPEYQDAWGAPTPWTAVEYNVYGYGYLSFPNASTLIFDFLNVGNGTIMDHFVLTQDSHGPFPQ